ncbi:hypothetical protein ACA910_004191 [Epithemia clementina (nom. ined.)]
MSSPDEQNENTEMVVGETEPSADGSPQAQQPLDTTAGQPASASNSAAPAPAGSLVDKEHAPGNEDGEDGALAQHSAEHVAAMMNLRVTLEDLEQQYYELKQDRDSLSEELQQARKSERSAAEASGEMQKLKEMVDQLKRDLQAAHSELKEKEVEAKNVDERAARAQAESDRLREEISRLIEKNSQLGAQVANMEIESKLQESEAIPLLHEKNRLQTEMESLQTHANWLQGELEAKTSAYQRLQHEAHDRQLQLQLQLQQTENDRDAQRVQKEELLKIEGRLQTKVEQLSHDIMLAKQELASVKESTALEVQEERKFANLQKEHLVRWEQRYNQVVRENEAMKEAAAKVQASLDAQLEQARLEVETKYKKLLETQASEFRLQIEQQETRTVPYAAALPAQTDDDDDAPMGLTEVYERLEQAKAQLRHETQRADRAELLNRRIVKEIEEKTPMLNRQREEYEVAMDQMKEYQSRLEDALRDKDEARADSDEARRAANKWRLQYDEKVTETKLLATQVQALLVSRAGGETDVPTSVSAMQTQNQRLLVTNKKLQEKVEELEYRLNEDELTTKLKAAKSELDALRSQRKLQEEAVEKIVQQRDLYRSLCNLSGNMAPGQELTVQEFSHQQVERVKKLEKGLVETDEKFATVSGERDFLKREKQALEERLTRYETHSKDLSESLSRLQVELQVARGDSARCQSEAKYLGDKCLRLEDTAQRLREELGHVASAKNELQRINAELQHSLTESRNLVAQKEAGKLQAETRLRLAETQADTARLTQKRATEEANQLRVEVARQGTLIDSIRRIENSLTAKSESEMDGLKEEVQQLKKTLASDRKRYESELENLRERVKAADARCLEAENARGKAQEEVYNLKKAAAEIAQPSDEAGAAEVSAQDKIDSLSAQLSAANAEISGLKESVESFKKAAKTSESSMSEVATAAATSKKALLEEVDRIKAQLDNAKKENIAKRGIIVEMTDSLTGQREERENAESALKSEISSLKAELKTREKDLESSTAAIAAMKLDLDNLRSEASEAQSNYERELKVHSEARSALRIAIEKAEEEAAQRGQVTREFEDLKSSIDDEREGWNQEKELLRGQIVALERSLKETREQNDKLHSQVEKLGSKVQEHLSSRADAAQEGQGTATVSDEAQLVIQEMRETVKFLRSENQLIQTQLDTALRSMEREKAAGSVLKNSLDDARSELASLRDQSELGKASAAELTQMKGKLRASDEQVALLGDSNRLLREECERARNNLNALQDEMVALRKQLEPADNLKQELEAKIAALTAEKESLRRELDAWKSRVENMVKEFNQVDPTEHSKALAKVDELMKEKATQEKWKETLDAENKRIREIARNLNQKQREQKAQLEEKNKEIENLKAEKESLAGNSVKEASLTKERDELKEKLLRLEKRTSSVETELEGANKRNDNLRERLRQFQMAIRDLKNKEQTLTNELSAARLATAGTSEQNTKAPQETNPRAQVETSPARKEKQEIAEKALDGDSKMQGETTAVPTVPDGGFSFGPSPSNLDNAAEDGKSLDVQDGSIKTVLRPDAPQFEPKEKIENIDAKARSAIKRQASGETMELSVKEKLMAKKRKLAAALSKHKLLEARKVPDLSEVEDSQEVKQLDQSDSIQGSVEIGSTQDVSQSDGEALSTADKAPEAEEAPIQSATMENNNITAEQVAGVDTEMEGSTAASNMDKNKGESNLEKGTKPENTAVPSSAGSSVANPYASNNPFGSNNPFASAAAPTFGEPSTSAASGLFGSGGFLNMKPPDSSSSPPSFSFGKSSITLPMPALKAPPPSPFNTFAAGSSYKGSSGGFGETQPFASHPLFGTPASFGSKPEAKQNEPTEETKKESCAAKGTES